MTEKRTQAAILKKEIDESTSQKGGPAFPFVCDFVGESVVCYGMSLRDWFAGQALTAVTMYETISPEKTAEYAYQLADAMIAARDGGQS